MQAIAAWGLVFSQMRYRIVGGGLGAIYSVPVGLDWMGAAEVLRLYGLWDVEVIDGLRIIERVYVSMEHEALKNVTSRR